MAKEWILNSAMNRFQLNFKRNVGPTSESIRMCAPKTLNEVINEIKQEIERLRK
ncbi:MAG TPA: MjaI family restriction endonuclease [Syntrophales bacterium]|nr:MjaI family restriction endonuclease [Syntrophales bacterium]